MAAKGGHASHKGSH
ncbi:hypothetical protein [Rickettsia asiatica]|nr:hypothetical protein [Rickettsia asiatica]